MKAHMLLALLWSQATLLHAHADEGGGSSRVGPDKGVLKVDEHDGFMLRPSAEKNFAIQMMPLKAGPTWNLPASSLVYSGLETQVFRQREGYWKSVDVNVLRRSGSTVEIRSKDLAKGDQLATQGSAFLKIIEQSVMSPRTDARHEDAHDEGTHHD